MKDIIEKIIDAGNHAPSGDNCQPWRFEVKENKIFLYILADRDTSLYSWGNRASYIANGAAIENMITAASHLGYRAYLEILPENNNPLLVAIISFNPDEKINGGLYEAIFKRTTNRKPYKILPLEQSQLEDLKKTHEEIDGVRILFLTDAESKKQLGKAAAVNEKILFGNFYMHKFFYDHINWDAGQELKHRIGFYVKTLEIPALAMPGFKMAKNWKFMKILNSLFGFSNFIAKQNSKIYETGSTLGIITLNGNMEKDYILAGLAFEKLWLKVTKYGLSLQPLTGIFLLRQAILANKAEELSPEQIQIISEAYESVKNTFKLDGQNIAFMFRIGQGGEPSARTLRLPPSIKWLN